MQSLKITARCLISAVLLANPLFGQSNDSWTIKPPHETYPVDPLTTATLKSTTEPTVALVLSAKPEHLSMPEHDVTSLVIYLDVGDDDFQIEQERWGKICQKPDARGGSGAGQHCQLGLINPAGIKVELTFDDGKPISDIWDAGAGSAFMSSDASRDFTKTQLLDKLQDSKKLVITYTLHGGIHKSATFDLSGASTAVTSLCPSGCNL